MTFAEYFKDWTKVIDEKEIIIIVNKLNSLYRVKPIVPDYKDIFKAFTLCSEKDCKVVFLGQDPYPQKGVATGVLFGNRADTKELSPSLQVLKESIMSLDSNSLPFKTFDPTMESIAKQGILMINSALTCEMYNVGSHVMLWRPFIKSLLLNLSKCETGIIYVLFGTQAQTFKPYINDTLNHVFQVNHPAYYARIGEPMPNDIFIQINTLLTQKYGTPIHWCIET